jgi:hypothetical protein
MSVAELNRLHDEVAQKPGADAKKHTIQTIYAARDKRRAKEQAA